MGGAVVIEEVNKVNEVRSTRSTQEVSNRKVNLFVSAHTSTTSTFCVCVCEGEKKQNKLICSIYTQYPLHVPNAPFLFQVFA